jgi:hypothetical protein
MATIALWVTTDSNGCRVDASKYSLQQNWVEDEREALGAGIAEASFVWYRVQKSDGVLPHHLVDVQGFGKPRMTAL